MKVSLLFAAAALVGLTACGGDKAATARAAYRQVSWAQAKALIQRCQAREVGQTHRRLVTLSLRGGGRRYTHEPAIDDVIDVVNRALNKCGPITFWTE